MSRRLTGTRRGPCCRLSAAFAGLPILLLFCLALPAATNGSRDAEWDKYPVAKWLAGNHQTRFRWRVEIPPAELSTHQRLLVRITTWIDGREVEKRLGSGELVTLLQFQDSAGRLWQNHGTLDLSKMERGIRSGEIAITHYAFVLPGDFTITTALIDARTEEHNVVVRKIRVAPLKTDPLPGAWAGLPTVEFIGPGMDAPDVWYLPEIENRLRLTLHTHRRVHIRILVNTTPSERASGSVTAVRRNMSLLIPALKVMSRIELDNGSMDAAFLDLTRRRVPFEQSELTGLDWGRARNYFLDNNPGIVDVRALQGQWKMRGFFFNEVRRRLTASDDAVSVVIVLSGAAFFENQDAPDLAAAAESPDRRLFYIRYRPAPFRNQPVRVRPGMRPPGPVPDFYPLPPDDLEHIVEPLGARIFDATSPEQFRRVLAAILEQIAQL